MLRNQGVANRSQSVVNYNQGEVNDSQNVEGQEVLSPRSIRRSFWNKKKDTDNQNSKTLSERIISVVKRKPKPKKAPKSKEKNKVINTDVISLETTSKLNTISNLISFLRENKGVELSGIFRESASHSEIQKWYGKFKENKNIQSQDLDGLDNMVASGILKKFFKETNIFGEEIDRKLIEDLLLECRSEEKLKSIVGLDIEFLKIFINKSKPLEAWQGILIAHLLQDTDSIDLILRKMHEEYLYVFNNLIDFLAEVSNNSNVNKMTSSNLALIFGALLIPDKYFDRTDLVENSQRLNYELFLTDISIAFIQKLIEERQSLLKQNTSVENNNDREKEAEVGLQTPESKISELREEAKESHKPDNVFEKETEAAQKPTEPSDVREQPSEFHKPNEALQEKTESTQQSSNVDKVAESHAKKVAESRTKYETQKRIREEVAAKKEAEAKEKAKVARKEALARKEAEAKKEAEVAEKEVLAKKEAEVARKEALARKEAEVAEKEVLSKKEAEVARKEALARKEAAADNKATKSLEFSFVRKPVSKFSSKNEAEAVKPPLNTSIASAAEQVTTNPKKCDKNLEIPHFSAIKAMALGVSIPSFIIGTGIFAAKRGEQIMRHFKLHEAPNASLFSLLSPYFIKETLPPIDSKNVAFYSLAIGGLAIGIYKTITTAGKLFENDNNKTFSKKCAEVLEVAFWVTAVGGSGYAAKTYL